MQRERGELVPIGEVVSGLDDMSVPAIRDDSPQARHHFTRFNQVDQLVSASEADPDLGFMAHTMALCSFPRTNPGNRHCQRKVARTEFSTDDRELGRPELTPLGEWLGLSVDRREVPLLCGARAPLSSWPR